MCVEDWQEGRELWLIIDRCAGGGSFERQSKGLQLNRVCIWAVLNRPCQKVPCDVRSWIQIAYICRSLRFRHGAWCQGELSQATNRPVISDLRWMLWCIGLRCVTAWLLGGVIVSWGSVVSMMQCPSLPIRTRGLVLMSPMSEGWQAKSTQDTGSSSYSKHPTPRHPTHRANTRLIVTFYLQASKSPLSSRMLLKHLHGSENIRHNS